METPISKPSVRLVRSLFTLQSRCSGRIVHSLTFWAACQALTFDESNLLTVKSCYITIWNGFLKFKGTFLMVKSTYFRCFFQKPTPNLLLKSKSLIGQPAKQRLFSPKFLAGIGWNRPGQAASAHCWRPWPRRTSHRRCSTVPRRRSKR